LVFTFGLVNSFFDLLTFRILLGIAALVDQFRRAWFVESVLTEIFMLLVLRTGRAFFRSAPSPSLTWAILGVAAFTLVMPYLWGANVLGFAPLSAPLVGILAGGTALLVLVSEAARKLFSARHPLRRTQLA
jgi:Mg2+-importing ATPase